MKIGITETSLQRLDDWSPGSEMIKSNIHKERLA